jgi:type II secretory pathway component GspD/PulD (secretin)
MPKFFNDASGRRILPIALALVFLLLIVFSGVAPSQEEGADKDRIIRQIVYNYIQVGADQYVKGFYDEAEKTFLMAQGYQEYLTVTERQQLEGFLVKTREAASQRKRIVETYQGIMVLLSRDQYAKAKEELEKIKDSQFLTKAEKAQIAEALQQIDAELSGARMPVAQLPIEPEPVAVEPSVVPSRRTATEEQRQIAQLYSDSMRQYRTGQLEKAREGFVKIIESGRVPQEMAKTLEGYIAKIDKSLKEKGKPTAPKEGVDRRTQTAELYKQSVELYKRGELERARAGFIKVARSGLLTQKGESNVQAYLQKIDRMLAKRTEVEVTRPEVNEPSLVGAEPATTAPGEESFIDVVNRKRNIVRSHTRAVVNDAITKAHNYVAQGDFAKAKEVVESAEVTVNTNQIHLGDELFKQYAATLTGLKEDIDRADNENIQKEEEEKRIEATEAQRKFREQMEIDRQKRIGELMKNAKVYQQQQRYEAALGQLESLLALDPRNNDALILKQTLEDMVYFKGQLEVKKEGDKQRADILLKTDESGIPYAEEITYPKNWREIVQKPTRKPDEAIGLDPADIAVYEQLDKIVDLSQLQPLMPFSEAIDVIKNSAEPPLKMVVLWRDLQANAQIEQNTQINMDGLPAVRLSAALENLLKAVSGAFAELGFVVENGVITVATVGSLPSKLETRVYDVTDLLGQPANYMSMPGMTLGGGMGGYGGGGMGGYGGGGMGGYGGGGMYGGGGGGMDMGAPYRAQDLVTLVQEAVDPDTWYDISTTGQGTIMPYPRERPKKLAVLQTREVHKKIEKLLAEMRRALGYQVAIEARYLVVSENFLEDVGLNIDWTYNLGGKWGQLSFTQGSSLGSQPDISTKVPGSLGGISPAANITGGYGSILDDLQVAFLIRATQAHTDAKSLTAPKVTVLSGETASFWVLNDVSYALPPDVTTGTSAGAYSGGGYQTSSIMQNIQRIQIGSTLNITPIITPDKKNVLLSIITELQDLLRMKTHNVEAVNANGDVAQYTVTVPETETSQVMTRVSVPDGGTLLLGGQKITAEVEKEVGVPVLSKIPVLGRLFGNRSKIKDEKILLILVKPTIILQEEREAEAIAAMESGS